MWRRFGGLCTTHQCRPHPGDRQHHRLQPAFGRSRKPGIGRQGGGGQFVNAANKDELDRIFEQVRETNRKILNDVRTTSATNVNDVRAVSAINNADVCITSLVNVEDAAMTSDLDVRDTRGQPVLFRAQAEALLKARHDELRRRLEDYRARLSSAQAAAKRSIDAAAEDAR